MGFIPLCIKPGEGDDIAHAELKLGSSKHQHNSKPLRMQYKA